MTEEHPTRREVLGLIGASTGIFGYNYAQDYATFAADPRRFIEPDHPKVEEIADKHRYLTGEVDLGIDWEYRADAEDFKPAGQVLETGAPGDCIAYDEEIITKTGIRRVEHLSEGDMVLSYDFDNQEYVYKTVTKKWDKGVQSVRKVQLRNGKNVQLTEDHPMIHRQKQHQYGTDYEKKALSEIDTNKQQMNRLPITRKLEVEAHDKDWFTEKHAYLFGHFCAEGWTQGATQASSSGYELEEMKPIMDELGIGYTTHMNGSGVPMVDFHPGRFRDLCQRTKQDSFNIEVPEWLLFLPNLKIKAFIDGYFEGDGHYKMKNETNQFRIYSTSSRQLASDLSFMLNRLGQPTYQMRTEDHQGVGDKPIYKLHTNPNSFFRREWDRDKLSEVSFKGELAVVGEKQVYDFEVKDTHNFVFKNGLIAHNCEDLSFIAASILENKDRDWKMVVKPGHTEVQYDTQWGVYEWSTENPENPSPRSDNDWTAMYDLDNGWSSYDQDWHK